MDSEFTVDHVLLDTLSLTNDDVSVKIIGSIDTDIVQKAVYEILNLDKKGLKFIPVVIHSGGGCVDDLLSLINVVESCTTPIMTICLSCACSAAACLFAMGSNGMRIMAPNSYLMFHESSMGTEGKQNDIACANNHFMKIDKLINKKIERHIDLENNYFENHSNDLYLGARDCLKLGIASHVGFPVIKYNISFDMDFEIKSNKRHEAPEGWRKYKYQKVSSGAVNSITDKNI